MLLGLYVALAAGNNAGAGNSGRAMVTCATLSILIACLCRAVVVVGDEQGHVGVGCASAKEVIQAVSKAVADGKRSLVTVPLTAGATFPHRVDAYFGAAKVTH